MAKPGRAGVIDDLGMLLSAGTPCGLPDDWLLEMFVSRPDGSGQAAFAALVQRHGPMVHRVCRGVLREWHDADDAYQATFLILARKARSIRAGGSIGSWLYGVVRRVAIHARKERTHRGERERSAGMALHERLACREQAELMPEVQEELDRLPEKYRASVVLCDLEGLTHEAAASALRVPVGTLKVRLFRGRERLRGQFRRRGLAPEPLAVGIPASGLSPPPSRLVNSTIRAAMKIAAGKAAGTSAPVTALVQGALRAMFLARLKSLVLLVFLSLPVILSATLSRSAGPQDREPPKAAAGKAQQEDAQGEVERFTETLKRSEFAGTLSQATSLEARAKINLFASVDGRLEKVLVDVGDHVTAGQVLAEIEAPLLLADLQEADALVAREAARVDLATAHLQATQAGLTPELSSRNSSNSVIGFATAQAKAELAMAQAELKVAKARFERARSRVSAARVVSPIEGVVSRRLLQQGEMIRSAEERSSHLFEILETSRLRGRFSVPEGQVPYLHKGFPVILRSKSEMNRLYLGKVVRIDTFAAEMLGGEMAVPALLEFENPDMRLRINQRVMVTVKLALKPAALTVPMSAVLNRAGFEGTEVGECFTVVDGKASLTRLKLGAVDDQGKRIEVRSGLKEGDEVITIVTPDIRSGEPIGSIKK